MKLSKEKLDRIHVKQLGEFACGLACLSTVANWYGGACSQDELRKNSGTTLSGTSLLGLCQAAQKIGFAANGFECSLEHLKTLDHPVILHVVKDNRLHFVVCFGFEEGKFVVGDPGWGVIYLLPEELDGMWQSKALLELFPTDRFKPAREAMRSQWKWFQSLIKADIPILLISAILGLLVAVTGLSTAIFSQKLIDDFLPKKDVQMILIGLAVLGALLAIRSFLGYLQGIFMARQGKDLNVRLVESFITTAIKLPISFFKGSSTGDLIARLNDSGRIRNAVSLVIGNMVINFLVIIVSLAYLFYYSWELGLIGVSGLVVYFLVAKKYHRPIVASQREMMAAHSVNESQYIESLSGIATIKSYGKEGVFGDRINRIFDFFQTKGYSLALLGNSFSFVTQLIAGFYITVIFGFGVWLVLQDQLQLGEMMALVTVGGSLMPAISGLVLVNFQLQEAKVAFDRLFEISRLEVEDLSVGQVQQQSVRPLGSLRLEQVSFRFPGKSKLLDQINFELLPGESVGVFGKIGSGKSTLVDMLQGFYQPEQGSLRMGEMRLSEGSVQEWRRNLAVVGQNEKVFNTTILDNIALTNDPNELEKVGLFLSETGFDALLADIGQGLLTLCGEEGKHLSGGQRQLVCLARALYKGTPYLILDESTSAMDFGMEKKVLTLLTTYCKRKQVGLMLVTHRLGIARQCDRIVVLEEGKVTARGSHAALIGGDNLYAKAYQEWTYLHATA
ncbi:MAG: peptidase domain-containing ABC transporter [Lunatimonas sp.]|uniref:peptidase domain-containing ABC transporter n=1 Tax=Lunatimonas sp. TaxID=2060141 RepID=UPI00263ADF81|nr:peptidase domain-containing ABC transporter [Lunatimonas sp.]MCC5939139.1 peptidase domain-containing ABC transporter [Lunatimonas sp.]